MVFYSEELLCECGFFEDILDVNFDNEGKEFWNWLEVSDLLEIFLKVFDVVIDYVFMVYILFFYMW